MSLIQKFSIKRINKIRKLLLLYIDKDLKIQQKNKKHFDCFSKQFDDKIFQKAYSTPINIEQYYSNVSTEQNNINTILVSDLSFNDFTYKHFTSDLKVRDSFQTNNNNKIKGNLSKKTFFQNNASENIINNLLKSKNERKHINKSEKSYIIIKDDKIKLKKTYLIDLSLNLKNTRKRRKCRSSIKIKSKENENNKNKDNKKTILEVKKKKKIPNADYIKNQKTAYANKRSLSTIDKKDLNILIKKQKRRSLFFKKK